MNRILRTLVLCALVAALAAATSYAQSATTTPAKNPATKSAMTAKSTSGYGGSHAHATARKGNWTREHLNSATAEELMKLPGVDQSMADKIIADRPYTSKSQLVSKKIMTHAEYAKISSRVWVKRESTQKKEAAGTMGEKKSTEGRSSKSGSMDRK
jgi:DNA uptake protein ComE-like DNA-binding protein